MNLIEDTGGPGVAAAPTRGLVLFDLDRTLIDESYRLTPGWEEHLRVAIREASQLGWLVGLNSDTPQAQLRQWWSRLGMNGPIVAERGAVVDLPDDNTHQPDFTSIPAANSSSQFVQLRQHLMDALLAEHAVLVVAGDATNFVRRVCPARRESHLDVVDNTLVVVNQYSRFSLRFFVRVIDHLDNGRLRVDREVTSRVLSLIEDRLATEPMLEIDPIEDIYGIVIVRDQRSRKRLGVQLAVTETARRFGQARRVVIVGDSRHDYVGSTLDVGRDALTLDYLAVANADAEFAAYATVMRGSFTEGCVEALQSLTHGSTQPPKG